MRKYMRAPIFFMIIALLLAGVPTVRVTAASGSVGSTQESGEATDGVSENEETTIRISNAEELIQYAKKCRVDTATSDVTILLTDDIDLSGKQFDGFEILSGTFDGQNHIISGVNYTGGGNIDGFFRYTTKSAVIKNLTVRGRLATIDDEKKLGGIVGANAGLIENVRFDGTVRGRSGVGGIAGINQTSGVIENCRADGSVIGYYQTGGIAGLNYGTISRCISSTDINRDSSWVETNDDTQITDIIENLTAEDNDGSVVSSMDTGGIAGYSAGVISYCTNNGDVGYPHAGYNVGGIAGRQAGYLTECTNKGTVYGRKDVGGITGQMEPFISLDDSDSVQAATQSLYYQINRTVSDLQTAESAARAEAERIRAEAAGAGTPSEEELREFAAKLYAAGSEAAENIDPSAIDPSSIDLSKINREELEAAYDEARQQEQAQEAQANADRISSDLRSVNRGTQEVINRLVDALDDLQDGNDEIYEDVSEDTIESAVAGKVERSVNRGVVDGDINIGGITGSMAIDSEDPEGNAAGRQTVRLGDKYQTECVLTGCRSYGYITARGDGAGGITGYQNLGIIHKSEAYGLAQSTSGSFVGGICGDSYSGVRECYADCEVSGERYIGGIAGEGYSISDCAALVTVTANGGNYGAIAGALHSGDDDEAAPVEEWLAERVYDNHFTSESLYGIDGISYEGVAEAVSYDDLIAIEGVPTAFRRVQILCVADDAIVGMLEVSYGERLDGLTLPVLEEKAGYIGVWPDLTGETATANRTLVAEYEKELEALASEEKADNGKAFGFIGGSFSPEAVFHITEADIDSGEDELERMIESSTVYELSLGTRAEEADDKDSEGGTDDNGDAAADDAGLPQNLSDGEYELRILTPAGTPESVSISTDGESWSDREWSEKGSYIELTAEPGTRYVRLTYRSGENNLLLYGGIAAGVVIVAAVVIILVRRRNRKNSN